MLGRKAAERFSLSVFPSLPRRGGRAIKNIVPFRKGADGVVNYKSLSECVLKRVVWLTTLYVSRSRAHAARPSAALRWLRDFLSMPQPPLYFVNQLPKTSTGKIQNTS